MLLITQQEVIDIAFMEREDISTTSIRSIKIDIAQEHFIRPRFGNKMFDSLLGGANADFVSAYIKPALAHFVRYGVVDEIAVQMSDNGTIVYRKTQSENNDTACQDGSINKIINGNTTGEDILNSTIDGNNSEKSTSTDSGTDESAQNDDGYNCISTNAISSDKIVKDTANVIYRSEVSQKSNSTTSAATDKQTSTQSSTNVQTKIHSNLREASPIEKRVLLQRALADANILLAKAVRYVENNPDQFPLYVASNFSKTILY